MRSKVTTLAEICGAGLCCYGISLLSLPAALIAGGLFLIAGGTFAA